MSRHRPPATTESGFTVVYIALGLTTLMLFTGVATDTGRAYAVRVQLSKAADGAALGAARMLNSGDAAGEARRLFDANFPAGYMGTVGAPGMTFNVVTDTARGENIVTVTGSATLPTTFMKLGAVDTVTVSTMAEARRRMVDLSFVLDVSSSIGSRWPAVRDAARAFIDSFDAASDRAALVTFGDGATVRYAMPASRGFAKSTVMSAIPNTLPGGSTAMVQGLYRGWDELRSVPRGQQSGLRVIVLFTDGASNSVPGIYEAAPGTSRGLRTYDFPKNMPDPDGQTWNSPRIQGLYHTDTGAVSSPSYNVLINHWNDTTTISQIPFLPLTATLSQQRSAGIPTTFPLQSATLKVDGQPQSVIRGLRHKNSSNNRYPAQVFNINNAARNLVEIIADAARSDNSGDYRIRIYTIGMGELVKYMLGTIPEKPEDILKRIANDNRSYDYNSTQLEGKYYFAATGADVSPAFQALQNEIIRLSK
jgi:hypothetical protein